MKNAFNNQVGMLGDMILWLVANLKEGVIYFMKQALPPNNSDERVTWPYYLWPHQKTFMDDNINCLKNGCKEQDHKK